MVLLAQTDAVRPQILSFPSTDGVTMALVLFQLAAMIFPTVIKNRQQYFASFAVTLGIILLFTLRLMMWDVAGIQVLGGVLTGFLQIGALILIFLSCGGMTIGQFAGELKGSYEVMRRGGEEKEVIIPLSGQRPAAAAGRTPPRREDIDDEIERQVFTINTGSPDAPATPPAPPQQPPRKQDEPGSIPLD